MYDKNVRICTANELYEAMPARKGKDAREKILCALIDYTEFHCPLEEKLMKEHQRPELENHKLSEWIKNTVLI